MIIVTGHLVVDADDRDSYLADCREIVVRREGGRRLPRLRALTRPGGPWPGQPPGALGLAGDARGLPRRGHSRRPVGPDPISVRGGLRGDRRDQALIGQSSRESSYDAVSASRTSPVLTVPAGSISIADTSPSVIGQCSTPRGTTWSWPGPRVTSPSRSRMVRRALDDEEELVGVVVGVPDELALHLHQLDLVVVEPGHHLGRPVLTEGLELAGDVDDHGVRLVGVRQSSGSSWSAQRLPSGSAKQTNRPQGCSSTPLHLDAPLGQVGVGRVGVGDHHLQVVERARLPARSGRGRSRSSRPTRAGSAARTGSPR